jgi:hypothetical protein
MVNGMTAHYNEIFFVATSMKRSRLVVRYRLFHSPVAFGIGLKKFNFA